jgi:hypothetical protein
MENLETIFEGLLALVRLDMQLRKTGKKTAERRQVEESRDVSWGLLQCVEVSVERAICGTYMYLPPDEMAVSPMAPAGQGRGWARTPLTHV